MGIKANFNLAQIRKRFDAVNARVDAAILAALKRLGEACVKVARENGNYIDQTGNLRSSTGYLIVSNGKIVESAFETAIKDTDGKGANTGRRYAEELAGKYTSGYALIVVAGMSYAAAVESLSKDVLTSAEAYANKKLPEMIEQLKKNIDKMRV